MSKRVAKLPEFYQTRITAALDTLGFRLDDARKLAACVQRLSDFYVQNPDGQSPWQETWMQAASLVYFFPLNYLRARAVCHEAQRLGFFRDIRDVYDFGSGTGSGLHAWIDTLGEGSGVRFRAGDVSREALALGQKLAPSQPYETDWLRSTTQDLRWSDPKSSALMASYVLTELAEVPPSWRQAEALMIIEPATHQDSRRLLQFRQELIDAGYSIWGPCTHQGPCPLLTHSVRDWCHDRIHFEAPEWFLEIEKHLPMKNRTLTFSYLLARKTAPSPFVPSENTGAGEWARLVGDRQDEKGKTRQSVCRNSDREFLAWFPGRLKEKDAFTNLERGDLVQLSPELKKTSNEIRLAQTSDVAVVAPDASPFSFF